MGGQPDSDTGIPQCDLRSPRGDESDRMEEDGALPARVQGKGASYLWREHVIAHAVFQNVLCFGVNDTLTVTLDFSIVFLVIKLALLLKPGETSQRGHNVSLKSLNEGKQILKREMMMWFQVSKYSLSLSL